jgi:hypothetical protein
MPSKSPQFNGRCHSARLLAQALGINAQALASATGRSRSGVCKLLLHGIGSEGFLGAVEVFLGQFTAQRVNAIGSVLGQSSSSGTLAHFSIQFAAITAARLGQQTSIPATAQSAAETKAAQ